jgi:diaminopimelate decarboxylase
MTAVTSWADVYGTPLYVYRLDEVRRAAEDLRAALPSPTRLYYSVKANPHPLVVAELSRLGLHAEVSSVGELDAVAAAGHPGGRCLYTGPGKTVAETLAAVRQGVTLFSVESTTDRRRLADVAARADTAVDHLVRLNGTASGASGLRMTGRPSPFGVDVTDTAALRETFEPQGRVRPVGVHVFPATNVADEPALVDEFAQSLATATDVMERVGHRPRLVDLGGGFAAPFAAPGERPRYPGLAAALGGLLDGHLPGWRSGEPTVAFESGRYLTGGCGTLLTTVLDVKRSRGTTYVVLDAGVNVLGGMSGIGRLMGTAAQPLCDGPGDAVSLVGPLCTPLDVLARTANVVDPKVGMVLALPNVGAYGLTASLVGFLGRPVAAEVVLDGPDDVVDVRRLELGQGRETT